MPKPQILEGFPSWLWIDYGPYMAVIEYWRDGDTPVLTADVGLDVYPTIAVRLERYSARESHEEGGEADLALALSIAPRGTYCQLYTRLRVRSKAEFTSFDRYVGSIVLSGGVDLSGKLDELKREGITM